ncbi:MAG: GntR family transcriptional regulator [Acidobacteria bacterium]|nr:GntR family transcriptional regulator [Acidobacteriota bacterium]
MIPFKVQLKPGISPYRQIIYAVEKSMVCGQLLPGDPFPSVRALSQALKINPNTAHKAIAELTRRGLLEVRPGIGTVVCAAPRALARERGALLKNELERLVVEAKRLSLDLDALLSAVEEHWVRLSADASASPAKKDDRDKE